MNYPQRNGWHRFYVSQNRRAETPAARSQKGEARRLQQEDEDEGGEEEDEIRSEKKKKKRSSGHRKRLINGLG